MALRAWFVERTLRLAPREAHKEASLRVRKLRSALAARLHAAPVVTMAGTEKRRSTERRNPVTIGVTGKPDSVFTGSELGLRSASLHYTLRK